MLADATRDADQAREDRDGNRHDARDYAARADALLGRMANLDSDSDDSDNEATVWDDEVNGGVLLAASGYADDAQADGERMRHAQRRATAAGYLLQATMAVPAGAAEDSARARDALPPGRGGLAMRARQRHADDDALVLRGQASTAGRASRGAKRLLSMVEGHRDAARQVEDAQLSDSDYDQEAPAVVRRRTADAGVATASHWAATRQVAYADASRRSVEATGYAHALERARAAERPGTTMFPHA